MSTIRLSVAARDRAATKPDQGHAAHGQRRMEVPVLAGDNADHQICPRVRIRPLAVSIAGPPLFSGRTVIPRRLNSGGEWIGQTGPGPSTAANRSRREKDALDRRARKAADTTREATRRRLLSMTREGTAEEPDGLFQAMKTEAGRQVCEARSSSQAPRSYVVEVHRDMVTGVLCGSAPYRSDHLRIGAATELRHVRQR